MTRMIICDDRDQARWKAERNKRITASEMNMFMGTAPSFYSDTVEEIIARKLDGTDKEFDERSHRRVLHGRYREENALYMCGALLGFPVVPFHHFISNTRWPYLGATLDGLLIPEMPVEPVLELSSNPRVAEVRRALEALPGPVLVEVKNSDSGHRYKEKNGKNAGKKAWVDFFPPYHYEQVQAQMTLAELDVCILCGSLGGDDMIPWLIERDPAFELVCDEMNQLAFDKIAKVA